MRKNKEVFALIIIGVGILFLILSIIQPLPEPFMIATGAAIRAKH